MLGYFGWRGTNFLILTNKLVFMLNAFYPNFLFQDLTVYKVPPKEKQGFGTIYKVPDLKGLPISYSLGSCGMPG